MLYKLYQKMARDRRLTGRSCNPCLTASHQSYGGYYNGPSPPMGISLSDAVQQTEILGAENKASMIQKIQENKYEGIGEILETARHNYYTRTSARMKHVSELIDGIFEHS